MTPERAHRPPGRKLLPDQPWSAQELVHLINRLAAGWPIPTIARELNRTLPSVKGKMDREGLRARRRGTSRSHRLQLRFNDNEWAPLDVRRLRAITLPFDARQKQEQPA